MQLIRTKLMFVWKFEKTYPNAKLRKVVKRVKSSSKKAKTAGNPCSCGKVVSKDIVTTKPSKKTFDMQEPVPPSKAKKKN